MKKHIITMVALPFIITSAFAGSPVAQVSTSGGITQIAPYGIVVHDDGKVFTFGKTRKRIARLSKARLKALIRTIDTIQEAELELEVNVGPNCTDIPDTTYTVINSKNQSIQIARVWACQKSVLPDDEGSDIVEILEGLRALNRL